VNDAAVGDNYIVPNTRRRCTSALTNYFSLCLIHYNVFLSVSSYLRTVSSAARMRLCSFFNYRSSLNIAPRALSRATRCNGFQLVWWDGEMDWCVISEP